MNKIYKLVWSKTKNMYVAVCEFAKSHTKLPKSGVMNRAVIASVLATFISFGTVIPVDAATNYDSLSSIGINQNSSGVYTGTVTKNGFLMLTVLANDTHRLKVTVNGKSLYGDFQGERFHAENTMTIPVTAGDVVTIDPAGAADLFQHGYFVTGGMSVEDIKNAISNFDGNLHVKGTTQLDKATTVGTTSANANLTVNGNETVTGTITSTGKISSNAGVAAGGKVTGVTAGTADTDALNVKQLKDEVKIADNGNYVKLSKIQYNESFCHTKPPGLCPSLKKQAVLLFLRPIHERTF